MADFNWDKAEADAGQKNRPQYLSYAPHGVHKVTLDHVEITDKDTWKSPRMVFHWMPGDYQYPRSYAHWLSMKNPAWRAVHNRNILMAFGFDKAKAQQLVEVAEKSQERKDLVANYQKLYDQAATRKVKTEVVVQGQYDRNGKPVCSDTGTQYSESDFVDRGCRMMEEPPKAPTTTDPLADAEEINLEELPF